VKIWANIKNFQQWKNPNIRYRNILCVLWTLTNSVFFSFVCNILHLLFSVVTNHASRKSTCLQDGLLLWPKSLYNIHKSRSAVRWANTQLIMLLQHISYFEPKFFYKSDIRQLFSATISFFFKYFFAPENMKNPPSKFAHNRHIFFSVLLKVSKSQKQIMTSLILQISLSWTPSVLRVVSSIRFLEESRTPYLFEIYLPLTGPKPVKISILFHKNWLTPWLMYDGLWLWQDVCHQVAECLLICCNSIVWNKIFVRCETTKAHNSSCFWSSFVHVTS
jgi:hypothetical protein